MRTVGLIALVIFSLPALAHASVIITEVMYDYPGTEGGGDHDWVEVYNDGQSTIDLGGSTVRFTEKGSNHIITSFSGSNTSLSPGATAIIANNPTQAKIDFPDIGLLFDSAFSLTGTTTPLGIIIDGVNVSPISYTPIASASNLGNSLQLVDGNWVAAVPTPGTYTNSSGSNPTPPDIPDTPSDTTDPQPAASSGSGTPEYLPVPTLRIIESVARTVSSGADVAFSAAVYDGRGNKRDDAVVTWSFGDGIRRVGASVYHQYYSPGEYLAVVRAATPDGGAVQEEIVMTVKDASIRISVVSALGIALTNRDTRTLDLSLWRVVSGGQEFRMPEDTHILAGRTILFSPHVTGLPVAETASLLYPSGEVAASYPETAAMKVETSAQPPAPVVSYKQVQKVEPITSTRTDVQSYEETGLAPTAATDLAAVGAALPELSSSPATGVFKSPWTLGLLGVMVTAAAAFILL